LFYVCLTADVSILVPVKPGDMGSIKLDKTDTRAPEGFEKKQTKEKTLTIVAELDELQNLLYAGNKYSVLVVLQGMDGSGKDGVIRNVFGHMNPQGVSVRSFKAPTEEELSHDFLWRIHKYAPAKGTIQIFNRSHYEDILVTRVHKWCDDAMAKKRMKAINDFEELLQEHNNTRILKFYLHISPEEQKSRLEERLKEPSKMWKYNKKDFKEADQHEKYLRMYEDCFENCNEVPWTIVPSDQNWYKEYMIARELRDTLKDLDMKYPRLDK
jgi:PPK2 family polyphosphate:nucleotide phosphotransferase